MGNAQACTISNHNIIRASIWSVERQIVEISGDVVKSTTIQQP